MDAELIVDALRERVMPGAVPDAGWWTVLAVVAGLAAVVVPSAWRYARVGVTIVHELGHAVVGIVFGRRFTGFVVNGDMSGRAVTVGPERGLGRAASTWAGYPVPGLLGALLVHVAFSGWAGTALFAALVVLLVSVVFARSLHTLVAVLTSLAVIAVVWWYGAATFAAALVLGGGIFLLLGAWRHVGAVARTGHRRDDPAQLARQTRVPAWAWIGTFLIVMAACTWWAWNAVVSHVG